MHAHCQLPIKIRISICSPETSNCPFLRHKLYSTQKHQVISSQTVEKSNITVPDDINPSDRTRLPPPMTYDQAIRPQVIKPSQILFFALIAAHWSWQNWDNPASLSRNKGYDMKSLCHNRCLGTTAAVCFCMCDHRYNATIIPIVEKAKCSWARGCDPPLSVLAAASNSSKFPLSGHADDRTTGRCVNSRGCVTAFGSQHPPTATANERILRIRIASPSLGVYLLERLCT